MMKNDRMENNLLNRNRFIMSKYILNVINPKTSSATFSQRIKRAIWFILLIMNNHPLEANNFTKVMQWFNLPWIHWIHSTKYQDKIFQLHLLHRISTIKHYNLQRLLLQKKMHIQQDRKQLSFHLHVRLKG